MEFPLFETLCIERGNIKNIALHQQRYEQSLQRFYANSAVEIFDILRLIEKTPGFLSAFSAEIIRCRLDYNRTDCKIRFFPYRRKIHRTFRPVICDEIDYSMKFTDRNLLNELFAQRRNCDEIMIIRYGLVTDCSVGNLVFRRNRRWFTPDSPLLNGTQRQKLLDEGKIEERRILLREIGQFDEIRLINAMNGLNYA